MTNRVFDHVKMKSLSSRKKIFSSYRLYFSITSSLPSMCPHLHWRILITQFEYIEILTIVHTRRDDAMRWRRDNHRDHQPVLWKIELKMMIIYSSQISVNKMPLDPWKKTKNPIIARAQRKRSRRRWFGSIPVVGFHIYYLPVEHSIRRVSHLSNSKLCGSRISSINWFTCCCLLWAPS